VSTSITVAGAVQFYMGTGGAIGARTFTFLGWSEGDTTIAIESQEEDYIGDYAGSRVPADVGYMAQEARITMSIMRTNVSRLLLAEAVIQGATPGSFAAQDIGTLMLAENRAPQLVVQFPYATKTPFANVGAITGMYFPGAWVSGTFDTRVSTKRTLTNLTIRAIPIFDAVTGVGILYYTSPGQQSSFPSTPGPD
jgi:hypothetical protein